MIAENMSDAQGKERSRLAGNLPTGAGAGISSVSGRAVLAYPLTAIGVTLLLLVLGLFGFAHFPKVYTAAAIITPPAELDRLNIQSGLSGAGAGSALSSLAALGGPQSAAQTRYETFVTLLSSRRIADAMIRDHDALRQLYPNRWDAQRNKIGRAHV